MNSLPSQSFITSAYSRNRSNMTSIAESNSLVSIEKEWLTLFSPSTTPSNHSARRRSSGTNTTSTNTNILGVSTRRNTPPRKRRGISLSSPTNSSISRSNENKFEAPHFSLGYNHDSILKGFNKDGIACSSNLIGKGLDFNFGVSLDSTNGVREVENGGIESIFHMREMFLALDEIHSSTSLFRPKSSNSNGKRKVEEVDDVGEVEVDDEYSSDVSWYSEGKKEKKYVTSIKDLPEELMLKIFSYLPDRYGFKSLKTDAGPYWPRPPLILSLVCKYWLNITRQTFLRIISIRSIKKIEALYHLLVIGSESKFLASLIRKFSIDFSTQVWETLDCDTPVLVLQAIPSTISTEYHHFLDSNGIVEAKRMEMRSYREMLKDVLKICPNLLTLDLAGVRLNTILFDHSVAVSSTFTPLYSSMLQQQSSSIFIQTPSNSMQLDSITTLSITSNSQNRNQYVAAKQLSSTLSFLKNLEVLRITRFRSFSDSPLTFLNSKARVTEGDERKLKIRTLQISESNFNSTDLNTLFNQFKRGSLKNLSIDQVFEPITLGEFDNTDDESEEEGKGEQENLPTLCSLPSIYHFLSSITTLRLSLYNYTSPNPALLPSTDQRPPSIPATLQVSNPITTSSINSLLPHLPNLISLTIGGPITTSNIFYTLPNSVEKLKFISCRFITPSIVANFLEDLASIRFGSSSSISTQIDKERKEEKEGGGIGKGLKSIEILGGATEGWRGEGNGLSSLTLKSQRHAYLNSHSNNTNTIVDTTTTTTTGLESIEQLGSSTRVAINSFSSTSVSGGIGGGGGGGGGMREEEKKRGEESWRVQRACWASGVEWKG